MAKKYSKIGGFADVYSWGTEELRKYNPFAPKSAIWYDFGNLQLSAPEVRLDTPQLREE